MRQLGIKSVMFASPNKQTECGVVAVGGQSADEALVLLVLHLPSVGAAVPEAANTETQLQFFPSSGL